MGCLLVSVFLKISISVFVLISIFLPISISPFPITMSGQWWKHLLSFDKPQVRLSVQECEYFACLQDADSNCWMLWGRNTLSAGRWAKTSEGKSAYVIVGYVLYPPRWRRTNWVPRSRRMEQQNHPHFVCNLKPCSIAGKSLCIRACELVYVMSPVTKFGHLTVSSSVHHASQSSMDVPIFGPLTLIGGITLTLLSGSLNKQWYLSWIS